MKNPAVTTTFQSKTRENIEAFVDFVERTKSYLTRSEATTNAVSLQNWANHFLDEISYFDDLRRSEKTPEAAEARMRSIKELLPTLDGDDAATTPPLERLQSFLEEITLDSEREEENDKAGEAVTLITMHSCKGRRG